MNTNAQIFPNIRPSIFATWKRYHYDRARDRTTTTSERVYVRRVVHSNTDGTKADVRRQDGTTVYNIPGCQLEPLKQDQQPERSERSDRGGVLVW